MLLRDLGHQMKSRDWTFADQIYEYCNAHVASGARNLLCELGHFRAYNDPVRKKAVFFLALMRNYGIWKYRDDSSLGPPVDYHEVRGHLRIGTVRIESAELLRKVRHNVEVTLEEDIAIRRAVFNAIMRISQTSGVNNPSKLHYLFWNIFRSICTREAPQCFELDDRCDLPDQYMRIILDTACARCPFASICKSAGVQNPICEHSVDTDYY